MLRKVLVAAWAEHQVTSVSGHCDFEGFASILVEQSIFPVQ